jgi:hypothetical protein
MATIIKFVGPEGRRVVVEVPEPVSEKQEVKPAAKKKGKKK